MTRFKIKDFTYGYAMKLSIVFGILIFITVITVCTMKYVCESQKQALYHGQPQIITLYTGNNVVTWETRGGVFRGMQPNSYYFIDAKTGKRVVVVGDITVTEL